MCIVKMFSPSELGLTDEEERFLCEYAAGPADSCYVKLLFDKYINDYDESLQPVIEKIWATGKVQNNDTVMIDLCW